MKLITLPFIILTLAFGTYHLEKAVNIPQEVQQLHKLSKKTRADAGCLMRQDLDPELCKVAQKWAENMAAKNCMYHGGGEQIIARGYRTPQDALRAWVNSPPHKKWIFSANHRVGFGYAKSKSGCTYWAGVYRK